MAQAAPADTRSSAIAQLLAPIAAPVEPRADRRFLRELRAELEQAWGAALHRYYAAKAWSSYAAHSRRAV